MDYIPLTTQPVGPTWEQLSERLRERCNIHTRSDEQSFSYKVVKQFDGLRQGQTISVEACQLQQLMVGELPCNTCFEYSKAHCAIPWIWLMLS